MSTPSFDRTPSPTPPDLNEEQRAQRLLEEAKKMAKSIEAKGGLGTRPIIIDPTALYLKHDPIYLLGACDDSTESNVQIAHYLAEGRRLAWEYGIWEWVLARLKRRRKFTEKLSGDDGM